MRVVVVSATILTKGCGSEQDWQIMSDSDAECSSSGAEDDSFRDHMERKHWDWIRKKLRQGNSNTKIGWFLSNLLRLDAPIDLILPVLATRNIFLNDCLIGVKMHELNNRFFGLRPLHIASIFSCDETFKLLMEKTKEDIENVGPRAAISHIGLIPFDRLRVMCSAFPTIYDSYRLTDYIMCRTHETAPTNEEAFQKYVFVLKFKLGQMQEDAPDVNCMYHHTHFLAPHALFLILLSEPLDGFDTLEAAGKRLFFKHGLPLLAFLHEQSKESFQMRNNKGDTLLHIFLRNVCRRERNNSGSQWNGPALRSLPAGEETIREFCRFLIQAHPEAAAMTDSSGCLPIHIAAEEGIPVEDILAEAYPEGLRQRGGTSNLYPFQFSASSLDRSMQKRNNGDDVCFTSRKKRGLERTFNILLADPSVLSICVPNNQYSRSDNTSDSMDEDIGH